MTEPVKSSIPTIGPEPLDSYDLNQERGEKLRAVIAAVLETNRQFNLTAVRDPDEAWLKHILDSLQGLRTGLFESEKSVIDIGAGAGFPSLALAAARPELKVTALEITRKKCGFIAATAEKLGLSVEVLCERAEDAGLNRQWREKFDIGVARAVGSFSEVCELTLPFVRPQGHLVLWRGQHAVEEVAASRPAMQKLGADADGVMLYPYYLTGHEMVYHLVVIPKVKPTPSGFPRRVGLPKQRPL